MYVMYVWTNIFNQIFSMTRRTWQHIADNSGMLRLTDWKIIFGWMVVSWPQWINSYERCILIVACILFVRKTWLSYVQCVAAKSREVWRKISKATNGKLTIAPYLPFCNGLYVSFFLFNCILYFSVPATSGQLYGPRK